MRRIGLLPLIALCGLLLEPCAAPLHAEEELDLADWDYEELRTGWSVERLRNTAEVIDQNGESVGTIKDLIIAPEGKVKRLVIEAAGGLFNLGAAQFAYPFDQATFDRPDRVVVALEEEHLEDYSLFAEENAPAQRRNWRVSELIRDYVYLADGYRFGWINDAIIGTDGTIKAVVVQPDVRVTRAPRPVALPFLPEEGRFDPSIYYYQLPFSADAVAGLDVFFYDQMETHTRWDEEQQFRGRGRLILDRYDGRDFHTGSSDRAADRNLAALPVQPQMRLPARQHSRPAADRLHCPDRAGLRHDLVSLGADRRRARP